MAPPFALLDNATIAAWPDLSPSAKAVCGALCSFMDRKGRCFPSLEKIGERAGIGRTNTLTAAVKELQEYGLIRVRRRQRQSSVYERVSKSALSADSKS